MSLKVLQAMAMLSNRVEPSYTDWYPEIEENYPWMDRFSTSEPDDFVPTAGMDVSTLDVYSTPPDPIGWFHPWWKEVGFPHPPVGYGDLPAHIRKHVNIPLTDILRKVNEDRPYVNVRTEMQRRFKNDGVTRRVHCGIDIPASYTDALYTPWAADYETYPSVSGAGKVVVLRLKGIYKVFQNKLIKLDGITLRYFHLSSFSIAPGTGSLNAGDKVGYVGKFPTDAIHLHLEVWWKDPKLGAPGKGFSKDIGICCPPQQLFELRSLPIKNSPRLDKWNYSKSELNK